MTSGHHHSTSIGVGKSSVLGGQILIPRAHARICTQLAHALYSSTSAYSSYSTESGEPTVHSVSNTSRTAYSESSISHDLYNVVLYYGVEKCGSGLSRSHRLESDLSIVNVFSALDTSIQPQSTRDCYSWAICFKHFTCYLWRSAR